MNLTNRDAWAGGSWLTATPHGAPQPGLATAEAGQQRGA